jgi:hypothetical protein
MTPPAPCPHRNKTPASFKYLDPTDWLMGSIASGVPNKAKPAKDRQFLRHAK